MNSRLFRVIPVIGFVSLFSNSLDAAVLRVVPIDLGSGFVITGTVSTNGRTGNLNAADITSWNLVVTETSQYLFTPQNTRDISTQVFSDGATLTIPTSPDGFSDGGSVKFYGHSRLFASMADFTGAWTSGGESYFSFGSFFDFLDLNQPNGSQYVVAQNAGGNLFNLKPVHYLGGISLYGWVRTNATAGAVTFTDWRVIAEESTTWQFTPTNSSIVAASGLVADGKNLRVTPMDRFGQPGSFIIGIPGFDPTLVVLADYSFDSGGVSGFINPFIYQLVGPLTTDWTGMHLVARLSVTPARLKL
ncbi:MAG: hypothetical protein U0R49_11780 [Fimbriimonadales bacterium]